MKTRYGFLLLMLLLTIGGCGNTGDDVDTVNSSTDTPSPSLRQPTSLPEAPTDEARDATGQEAVAQKSMVADADANAMGSFRGVVTFVGDVPAPQVIQVTKDSEVCGAEEREVTDVFVTDGKLAGAVVEITVKGQADPAAFKTPDGGFVVRQKDCLFSPRLVVAFSGAELTVHNDDKVEHNVNTGEWNLLQSPGAPAIKQPLNYGGNSFTRVTCNIHGWMESWVYLARSPYYAASNEKGEFVIEDIPVGAKIRGTISHATLGKQRFNVDVVAGETTEQNFEFAAK